MGARIIGTGSAVPLTCLTNADMEKRVATSHDWMVSRTGIYERRVMKQGEDMLDLMYAASTQALDAAGLSARTIQAIVVATVSVHCAFPSTACLLRARLGLASVPPFDVCTA